ncbi:YAP-binding/ALF4/Glomulin [Lipomyces chichibuensis]|uniref:YAP-binding/ALF4/Glomulin n=1 Tax=Lipomyces chichibuensis TaxID=1546026 RepID=UPI003344161F
MASSTTENTTSIEDAIHALTGAAQDAVESDDYITYSTLLDVYLGNPNRYKESERVALLQALESILRRSEILLSYVAWDLPVLLLPYLASADPFDSVAASKVLTPRKAVLKIFNLIAEKGNAKEVFLKSIEALSTLNVDFPLDATPEQILDCEKLFVLKFYALFEVIISVTRRITTQYPSRFLTTSSTALLSFFSGHVDELSEQSLPVLLRRLYLFARDYVPPPSKTAVEPEEEALQRRMLQSYVTHMVEIMLRNKSVAWSRRYFAEIKPQIDVLPIRERERPLSFDGALSPSIIEMLERFLQLTSSFDIAPEVFAETLLEEPPELELDNEPEVDPSFPSPPASSSSIPLSAEGCFFLLAEFLVSEPRSKISFTFPDVIRITKRFIIREEGESPGVGVCDAVGFYAWKFLKDITPEEIASTSPEEFNGYLQVLTSLSATSPSPTVRFIFHTLVVHLLSRSSPERSYGYIYDTLQFCPFENVCGAFVIVLKDFLDISSQEPAESSRCRIIYEETKRKQVEDLIESCLSAIETSPDLLLDERYPTLLAWVNNFLVVVGGEKAFLDAIIMRLHALIQRDKLTSKNDTDDDERIERNVRAGILTAGMELLEKAHSLESAVKKLSIKDDESTPRATPAAAA